LCPDGVAFGLQHLFAELAGLPIQHGNRLLARMEITSYNSHRGLLRPERCEGGHRTVYAGRREADIVMTSGRAYIVNNLSAAFRSGRLADALARYVHPTVLICDEVGYLTYGTDAANMLFHVVNDRHRKKRAMIFTTTKPLAGWGRVLHDEDLAHAIVDRILERGRMLTRWAVDANHAPGT
jgi:hypothetical protein